MDCRVKPGNDDRVVALSSAYSTTVLRGGKLC